jgi:hypothetical protein
MSKSLLKIMKEIVSGNKKAAKKDREFLKRNIVAQCNCDIYFKYVSEGLVIGGSKVRYV